MKNSNPLYGFIENLNFDNNRDPLSENIAALFHLVIFPGQKSAAAIPSFSGKSIATIS